MIRRNLAPELQKVARWYPIATVVGPRQSGKTTLCRQVFPDKAYVSLEALDVRRHAVEDPRGFIAEHADGAIIDEVQHAPELLSYLQVEVDARPEKGRFVLTGSQHLAISGRVSQSLAGRTAVLQLLPLSLDELQRFERHPKTLLDVLWQGAWPAIHDRQMPADRWLADYVATYVQRDARDLLRIGDLQAFTTFIRLCAGRTSGVLNLSSLGADLGISHNTARSWLSVLEASFLVFRLPPWHRNLKTQLVKAAKLHLWDSGLACHLLAIRSPEELRHHPLRGAIFESWVVAERAKALSHAGQAIDLHYFRDHKGLEVDLVHATGGGVELLEVKAGATVPGDAFASLNRLAGLLDRAGETRPVTRTLVFGGDQGQQRSDGARILPWSRPVGG